MSKNNYWQDRFIEEEERLNKIAGDEFRRQQLEYERAIARMNKDIEVWYNRIAKNNDVSLAEAKKMLNDKELKEFRWTLDEYIKYGKENGIDKNWNKELENASARVHIERLEAMKLQVRGEIEKLYNARESGFESYLKNLYKNQYNRTAFQIAKGTGVGTNIYSLNDKLVNTVIKKPWAPDGKNFSDRIWEDKDKLINTLHTEMTQAFIRGDSLEKLADKIAEKMKVSKANASRLVYTESAAYSSIAKLKSYQDLGVEKYEIVATLDNRTSDICQDMDGKVFDLKDYEVGVTANPFHVRCRTTTAPYFDDMQGERAARNETTGETEYVPADITYKDWKEKYLSNTPVAKTEKSDIIRLSKTLQEHKKHTEDWYAGKLKGLISKEDEIAATNKLQNIIDNSEFSMRFNSNNIDSLLDSNRFMNQFETGTSGGTISDKFRKEATRNLFGAKIKLKPEDYEKYGYLASNDFLKDSTNNWTLDMYGDTIIRFNKDKLKGKVTFTVDDSLGNAVLKKVIAISTEKAEISAMDVGKIRKYTDVLINTKASDVIELTSDLGVRYIELQYHGELKLDEVESICFTDKLPSIHRLESLKNKGIKLYKIEGGKIVEI